MNTYFSRHECPVPGTEVKSLVEFSGVPVGTKGMVVGNWAMGKGRWGVTVQWIRAIGGPLSDGFSKNEYQSFLQEVRG
jgi:hypothetical protein